MSYSKFIVNLNHVAMGLRLKLIGSLAINEINTSYVIHIID